MAYNYDDLYGTTPDALGAPTAIFVDHFNIHRGDALDVLDVGCGQGRDAVFIARLGHSVVGVDMSPNGIRDLVARGAAENLSITGICTDIVTYAPTDMFDVVLIDRTLHMLATSHQLDVLARLIAQVHPNGWVLIADEASNIKGFRGVFDQSAFDWAVETAKGGTLFMRRV